MFPPTFIQVKHAKGMRTAIMVVIHGAVVAHNAAAVFDAAVVHSMVEIHNAMEDLSAVEIHGKAAIHHAAVGRGVVEIHLGIAIHSVVVNANINRRPFPRPPFQKKEGGEGGIMP